MMMNCITRATRRRLDVTPATAHMTNPNTQHSPRNSCNRNDASRRPRAKSEARARQPFDGKDKLCEIMKVRLLSTKRLIEVNVCEKHLMPNEFVLVRLRRNVALAQTVGHRYRRVVEANSLPFVVRYANDEDHIIYEENKEIEKRAQSLATQFSFAHKLNMKVLSADLSHDRKNITINFASDVRVDFREMVSFLASKLSLRIEMYQLGIRNGTGLLTGLGSCGQHLCCGRFLSQFDPIAVKLLKAQGLVSNPKRISGLCGRLYCCLSYEYCDYVKSRRMLPKHGRRILSRWGYGRVASTDPVREEVIVNYDNGEQQRLSLHDFILVSEEGSEGSARDELVFPLEPARFYLNSDPSTACELTGLQGTRTAYSKPKLQAVSKSRRSASSMVKSNEASVKSEKPSKRISLGQKKRAAKIKNKEEEPKEARQEGASNTTKETDNSPPSAQAQRKAPRRRVHHKKDEKKKNKPLSDTQAKPRQARPEKQATKDAQTSASAATASNPTRRRPRRNSRKRPSQASETQG
ncbi:MAG: PSP1 domain-containing protein [Bradymonadia bacterium]